MTADTMLERKVAKKEGLTEEYWKMQVKRMETLAQLDGLPLEELVHEVTDQTFVDLRKRKDLCWR